MKVPRVRASAADRIGSFGTGRGRPALGLLVAAIVATALPGSAIAAPSWLAETSLSAGGANAYQPQVAVGTTGDTVAVWTREEEEGYGRYVVQAAGRTAGGVWGPATDLSVTGRYGEYATDPQVAVDPAGDAVAIWEDGEEAVRASTGTAGGAWGAPVELTVGGGAVYDPQVAVDRAGDAVVVWRHRDGSSWLIQAVSRPAGGVWGPPIDLSASGNDVEDPRVAVDPAGDAVAIWQQVSGSDWVVEAANRPVGGGWSLPVPISATGESAEEPQLVVDPGGDALAVWRSLAGYVVEAASGPAGRTWGAPVELTTTAGNVSQPLVAMGSGGAATVIWRYHGASGYAVRSASRTAGGGWQPPVDVSAAGEDPEEARVAVDAKGDALVLWQIDDGSGWVVQATSRTAGGAWAAPVNVSGIGLSGAAPEIAVDEAGDAAAVWRRFDGSFHIIQAAGYDAAGPQLRSLSIPASGMVGQTLSFSVSPLDVWSSLGAVDWSFGDGAAAVGTPVTHTFTAPGTYTVSVGAADALGNPSGASGTVTITAAATGAPPGGAGAATGKGRVTAVRLAWVRGEKAWLRLACPASDSCSGVAELSVASKSRKRPDRGRVARLPIGRARFDLAPGKKKTVPAKLTKAGGSRLRAAGPKGLKARLGGTGVAPTAVTLKAVRDRRR